MTTHFQHMHITAKSIRLLGMILIIFLLSSLPMMQAQAAPLRQTGCTLPATVTTTAELSDCITEANANGAGLDTITLGADITLSAALPQITSQITVEGAGYAIDGGNSIQLFNIGIAGDFTVNQTTLQNGSATNGGAVYNDGTLTLNNSTLSGNTATINGGAVYNDGRLTLNNSTLSDNTATNGGAIYNVIQSTVTATNSTFSGNIATNHGAAVYNYSSATVKATNSTFSGNIATNSGGGVYNRGRLTLTSSTFTGNAATTASSIYNDSTGILHLAGNLFAATGDNCSSIGTLNDNGYNLSDDATCTNGGFGSLTNATLNLGALTDNGGLTLTHLPGAGSDAIGAIPYGTTISNNGTSWTCDQSVTDQRGEPRPIDSGDGCTAGAVEVPLCPSWTATTAAELYQCILKANGNESPSPTADTITLGANIDLTTLTAAPLPQITSEITLEGANHVIDGGNSVQLFYVDAGGDFTVNQATLQNGSANDTSDINGDGVNGGGINNNGKLTVTNSTISGNTAVASGGGIFNGAYGTLAVANSTISGNTATGDTATATPGYGGGIYSFNATVTVTNSAISNNTAAGGGGIYLNRGTATVTTSTISGNSATNGGGGININSYGTVAVTNSTISANSAANGGGIKNSSTATVTDSTISSNSATNGGGGIDNDSTLTVTNSTISGNTVSGTGDGGGINNSGTATVTDSTLHSNTANRRGAGINNSGTLTVTTSTFSGNSATTRGGGIYNNGGTLTVTTSTFSGNSATAIGVGGVYNNGGTAHLAGVILDNGTSGANCSASITDNGYNLSDDASCGFSGTSANMVSLNLSTISHTTTPGQQVHTPQTGSDAIGAIPYGTTINNNGVTLACNQTATDQLGADRPITAFTACTAGAVEVTMPPICTSWTVTTADELYDCIIVANNNESPSPTANTITLGANINLTTLTTSPLPRITSAITLEGAGYAVDGGNSVQLFYVNSGGDFTVNQATLQNGSATSGGGIRNYGTVTVINSTISGNTADTDGGGIDNYNGTLTVTNSTISGNSAGEFGGGIGNGGTLTVTNSTISGNTAGSGGGIDHVWGTTTVTGSTISGNTATGSGGGILSANGTVAVSNSTISGNTAGSSGGGIKNTTGTLTVTNSTISGNSAATVGGGIVNNNGPLTVTNSTFSGNTAAIQGGGIYQEISGSNPVYLAGVILFRGTSGANCSGSARFSDNGYNLSSDGSCGFSGTSANNATLNLSALSATTTPGQQVHTPQTGSDAIGAIPNGTSINNNDVTLACNGTTTDQLGTDRPINIGTACTSGAVEVEMPPICPSWTVTTAAELSDCITLANGNENPSPTADTITLGADITLSTALPQITSEITLEGAGYAVDGGWNGVSGSTTGVQIFYVASTGDFTVNQVTLQKGTASLGGGIYNRGALTVSNSTFSGNGATDGSGIYNTGTLAVSNSTFSSNTGWVLGGGINNQGTGTVSNSTFSDNRANYGGGIYNTGTLIVSNITFSGNRGDFFGGSGGGIHNGGTLTVSNSTFSGNIANYGGGGIYNAIIGTVHLAGTIFADSISGDNCLGTLNDNGYNLSDDASCGFTGMGSANSATLNLSALSVTTTAGQQVHTPQTGSDAIGLIPNGTTINNNGVTLACNSTTTDQLGADRPINIGTACTSGAVEVAMPPVCTSWTATTADELYECIVVANGNEDPSPTADTITLGANITLTTALPQITSEITLEGAGYAIDGGGSVGIFFVRSSGNLTVNQATLQNGSATDGGGIYINAGTVTVTNSTFSSNLANIYGGGIYNNDGTLTVTNSTFSGNSATFGGGIANFYDASTVRVTNSTFFGNSASIGDSIYNNESTLHLAGNILDAGMTGNNCFFDAFGIWYDNGYNLSDDASCGFSGTGSANNATLALGALADNGGPTQTHLPGAGSDAIGVIPNGTTITNNTVSWTCNQTFTDQLGADRPINIGTACTAGAVEVASPVASLTIVKDAEPADGTDFSFATTPGLAEPTYLLQWGGSGSGNGQFDGSRSVAVDGAGNVYVVDGNNDRIQKFDSDGNYLTQWGSLGTGNGQFDGPRSVAVDGAGNVYVVDGNNDRIQKFDSSGGYLTQWGSSGSGNGQFDSPYGVAVDGAGNVYVVDRDNHRIQKFDSSGAYVTQWGSNGSGDGQFNDPVGVVVDGAGNVYVADRLNHRIQKFDSDGNYLTQWGSNGSGDGQFNLPYDVAVDGAGNVYVADALNHRIQKFDTDGDYLTQWGSIGSGNGQFDFPEGVAVDGVGAVYVADANNNRIQKFSTTQFTLDDALPDDSDGISDTITFAGLAAGSYSFTETLPLDWHLEAVDCDSGSWTADVVSATLTVNLSAGQNITCTFSNAYERPNFVVNTNADTDDGFCDLLGQGVGNQDCTLREAINAANDNADASTITFAADYTITLTAPLPNVATEITISGVGQSVTVDGNNNSYQMFVVGEALTINSLTLANGLDTIVNSGDLTVLNSTLRNGAGDAGGIYSISSGQLIIANSTFYNNQGTNVGAIQVDAGTAVINNVTLSGNSGGLAGGIYTYSAAATVTNSIITNSTGGDCGTDGGSFGGGNNLIDDHAAGACAGISSAAVTNLAASPADNGGDSHTITLLIGSNALDAGNNATCEATDQRGVSRPYNASCDIGAVEQTPALVLSGMMNGGTAVDFTWNYVGYNDYQMWRSTSPYAGYSWYADVTGLTFNQTDLSTAYYEVYGTVDGRNSLPSNRIGVFSFTIVPGE